MLRTDLREGIVEVRPTVAVGVCAPITVAGGGPWHSGTYIALEAIGVVAIAVFVDIGPLSSVQRERVHGIAVTVIVAVGAAEYAPEGTGSGDLRAIVLVVIEPVVIVVHVLARILASVSVRIVAAG